MGGRWHLVGIYSSQKNLLTLAHVDRVIFYPKKSGYLSTWVSTMGKTVVGLPERTKLLLNMSNTSISKSRKLPYTSRNTRLFFAAGRLTLVASAGKTVKLITNAFGTCWVTS
jgi:hypothetical protein